MYHLQCVYIGLISVLADWLIDHPPRFCTRFILKPWYSRCVLTWLNTDKQHIQPCVYSPMMLCCHPHVWKGTNTRQPHPKGWFPELCVFNTLSEKWRNRRKLDKGGNFCENCCIATHTQTLLTKYLWAPHSWNKTSYILTFFALSDLHWHQFLVYSFISELT